MDTYEKLMSNHDVLESIFQYVDLKEQLKISQICQQFELSITQLIWRIKCKNMTITETFPETVMLKCNKYDGGSFMDYESIKQFLALCSPYLQHLEVKFVKSAINRISFEFGNLTTIILYKSVVNQEILLQVATNCLKLSKLHMKGCRNFDDSTLIIGRDVSVGAFEEMKKLHDFTFISPSKVETEYAILQQLYKKLKLRTLCIKSALHFSPKVIANMNEEAIANEYSIENLSIERFCDQASWRQFSFNCLAQFKNLTKLHIKLDTFADLAVDDDFLHTLATKCQLLQDLTLEHCKLTVEHFCVLANLTSLTINWCRGLSAYNLRDIFSGYKLLTFNLLNTYYQNNITAYSYSSDTLKTLQVETCLNGDITPALTNVRNHFENVSTLIWLHSEHSINESSMDKDTLTNISNIYPNLRKLILQDHHVPIEDLKRLKYLNILKFQYTTLSWSYIELVLKLPSLLNLNIGLTSGILLDIQFDAATENYCQGLTENLEYLKMPLIVFSAYFEFWLAFLQRNAKLKFTIFTNRYENLLHLMSIERKLSQQSNNLNICDFMNDYKTLKSNRDDTLRRFDIKKNDQGEHYIILQNPK